MSFLDRFRPAATVQRSVACGRCAFFNNDPQALEAAMPGLRSLGSATASVRSDDGLCSVHDRYLGARCTCPSFRAASPG